MMGYCMNGILPLLQYLFYFREMEEKGCRHLIGRTVRCGYAYL